MGEILEDVLEYNTIKCHSYNTKKIPSLTVFFELAHMDLGYRDPVAAGGIEFC